MALDFFNADAVNAGSSAITALANGALGPVTQSYNKFMDKIGAAVSPTRRLVGSPYARQNNLQKRLSRPDPVMSFDWLGVIVDPGLSTAVQLPWYYIDGIQVPGLQGDSKTQPWNGMQRSVAGGFTAGGGSLTLYNGVDGSGLNYAHNWFRSAYRSDGYTSLPAKYKKDILIFILDARKEIVIDIRIIGAYATSVNEMALGSDNSVLELSVPFSCADVVVNYDSDLTAAKDNIDKLFSSSVNDGVKRIFG